MVAKKGKLNQSAPTEEVAPVEALNPVPVPKVEPPAPISVAFGRMKYVRGYTVPVRVEALDQEIPFLVTSLLVRDGRAVVFLKATHPRCDQQLRIEILSSGAEIIYNVGGTAATAPLSGSVTEVSDDALVQGELGIAEVAAAKGQDYDISILEGGLKNPVTLAATGRPERIRAVIAQIQAIRENGAAERALIAAARKREAEAQAAVGNPSPAGKGEPSPVISAEDDGPGELITLN